MYVFPLAGRPTIDITVGHFTTFGHVAESIQKKYTKIKIQMLSPFFKLFDWFSYQKLFNMLRCVIKSSH